MNRLTFKRTANSKVGYSAYCHNNYSNHEQAAKDKLAEYEDKIERGELVEVVTCEHCINHVDMNYHFCRKLRIECPNDSDFYCKYGERSVEK